jgi:hypothetical protein
MNRKKWSAHTEVTEELVRQRDKRKWQIALRRYIFFQSPCSQYAPYFGLDAKSLRSWVEAQFEEGMNWDNFSDSWQFDHIVPVSLFNFEDETDMRLCWNFTNLGIQKLQEGKPVAPPHHMLDALQYFTRLAEETGYEICKKMLDKINSMPPNWHLGNRASFINQKKDYIQTLSDFNPNEYDRLNVGVETTRILEDRKLLGH